MAYGAYQVAVYRDGHLVRTFPGYLTERDAGEFAALLQRQGYDARVEAYAS